MIQAEHLAEPARRPVIRVINGGKELDLERFAATQTMLEAYVDGVLAAGELSAMDPWVDDQVMDVRAGVPLNQPTPPKRQPEERSSG